MDNIPSQSLQRQVTRPYSKYLIVILGVVANGEVN